MPWFKADDGLHSHRKTAKAGVPAMGLWIVAGTWCAGHLTDGFVPDYMARRLDPDADEHAAALVTAGLWEEAEVDGDSGWRFRAWGEYQPTREDVEAERERVRTRVQTWRERRRNAVTNAAETVPPTRPDPTRPEVPIGTSDARKRAARISPDFAPDDAMREWAAREAPAVDVDLATAEFVDYWSGIGGQRGTKLDWAGTWRNWLRRKQGDARPLRAVEGNRLPAIWRGVE